MVAARARRAALALVALAVLYAVAAEIGRGRLPDRIWMGSHYVDNIQLLPTWRSLAEEGAFLIESDILVSSAVVSTRRVLAGLLLGSLAGILIGLATGWARRLDAIADRLYAIDRGEIIYQGDPRKVLENKEVMSTIHG